MGIMVSAHKWYKRDERDLFPIRGRAFRHRLLGFPGKQAQTNEAHLEYL